ncbi:hypothetical protein RFI_35404 [Reticulomyxa filosa]|uniref:Uncharacterized protein n=1 Tax=Reticulomyxa filosa TaxID=46433 RepID=X6LLM0_RETFI|nr:hypothetical protein RFI_35404 [Reticulomyxa filosa]|eukprot:ETO02032.1 hypothetical protein RFI_35404 [Reticulomyxa filosa]
MKPSLVYEIVLILLQVLTAVLAISSVSNVAKENSNSKDTIYSNNQDCMCTLLLSLNKLSNHSASRMWKSKTLKCVQCPQYFDNATEISLQLKHASIRIIKITTMQSKKNTYTKTPAIDMFTTSSISSTYFKPKYRGRMYCTYDVFDLKWILKKKNSVCTSIEVEVGVIVITAPQLIAFQSKRMAFQIFKSTRSILPCNTIRYSSITNQLVSNTFQILLYTSMLCFFLLLFLKTNKKKMDRSYDVAQKKRNIDDIANFDNCPIDCKCWCTFCGKSVAVMDQHLPYVDLCNTTDKQSNCKSVVIPTFFVLQSYFPQGMVYPKAFMLSQYKLHNH